MSYSYGRLPRDKDRPVLKLENYVAANGLPPVGQTVDRASKVSSWPMYGNDEWGDCEFARVGHMIQAWTAFSGSEVTISASEVLRGYSRVTGFDPNAGPPGDNPTDNGANTQDVLNDWKNHGYKDTAGRTHKVAGYAAFGNPTDFELLHQVLNTFGSVALDINCPASAQTQFAAGEPWTYDPSSPIEGGHAIDLQQTVTDQEGVFHVVTWGKLQPATIAFVDHYVDDAWVVVTQDWIDANGTSIEGLNLTELLSDMQYV